MVIKSVVNDEIQQRVEKRPGGLFYLHRRWAPAADLVAIVLTSLLSYQLAHHLLSGRQDLGGWYVATDAVIAVVWFAALSLHMWGRARPCGRCSRNGRRWWASPSSYSPSCY